MKEPVKELEIIRNTDVRGHIWKWGLRKEMLSKDGHREFKLYVPKDAARYSEPRDVVLVLDREYVLGWLLNVLIRPLDIPLEELIILITEAYANHEVR